MAQSEVLLSLVSALWGWQQVSRLGGGSWHLPSIVGPEGRPRGREAPFPPVTFLSFQEPVRQHFFSKHDNRTSFDKVSAGEEGGQAGRWGRQCGRGSSEGQCLGGEAEQRAWLVLNRDTAAVPPLPAGLTMCKPPRGH